MKSVRDGGTMYNDNQMDTINDLNVFRAVIVDDISDFNLFVVLRRFQHCTGHITTGSWNGRGNQYV